MNENEFSDLSPVDVWQPGRWVRGDVHGYNPERDTYLVMLDGVSGFDVNDPNNWFPAKRLRVAATLPAYPEGTLVDLWRPASREWIHGEVLGFKPENDTYLVQLSGCAAAQASDPNC